MASSNLPGRRAWHRPAALSLARTARYAVPIRFCSRWGLPCRLRCRTRGALLPHLFTLTCLRSLRCYGGRFVLCGTFPGVTPAGRYPAPHVKGARTFLPGGLSAPAGAAVRPTDGVTHGAFVTVPSSRDRSHARFEINYPEDVVWSVARSTGCRRGSRTTGV